jgi:hypothetical protein
MPDIDEQPGADLAQPASEAAAEAAPESAAEPEAAPEAPEAPETAENEAPPVAGDPEGAGLYEPEFEACRLPVALRPTPAGPDTVDTSEDESKA